MSAFAKGFEVTEESSLFELMLPIHQATDEDRQNLAIEFTAFFLEG